MENLYIVIGFYGGIILIGWLFSKVSNSFRKHREKIRNQVAEEILSGLNIEAVIDNYKSKLAHIGYIKTDPIRGKIDRLKGRLWGRDAVLMNGCPKCKEGYLIVRKGQYGKFMGCTKFPKCDYTNNIVKAREEYKKSINEQIIDDIRRAYPHL